MPPHLVVSEPTGNEIDIYGRRNRPAGLSARGRTNRPEPAPHLREDHWQVEAKNLLILTYHGILVRRPRQMPLNNERSSDLVPGDLTQGGPRCRRESPGSRPCPRK